MNVSTIHHKVLKNSYSNTNPDTDSTSNSTSNTSIKKIN